MNRLSRCIVMTGIAACWWLSTAAAPAIYVHAPAAMTSPGQTTQVESVSGRITAVAGNTLTIELMSPEKDGTKALTIAIDQDTAVHGKIAVGLKAEITFRREDHNNIAVTVRTSPA